MWSYILPNKKNEVISIFCIKEGYSKITSYFTSKQKNIPTNFNKGMKLVKIRSKKNNFILVYDIYLTLTTDELTICKAYFSLDKKTSDLNLLNIRALKSTNLTP